MKTATYKFGQTVKTPHGSGKIIAATPHRLNPEEDPSVWVYGVEFVPPLERIPSNQMPYLEAELDVHNVTERIHDEIKSCCDLKCLIADIRDKLTDVQELLKHRPGSLALKLLVEDAICLTNVKGL